MRAAGLSILLLAIALMASSHDLTAQVVKTEVKKDVAKKEEAKTEEKDEPFNQLKADLETIKSGGYADDVKSLTDFFRNHTVKETDKAKVLALIKKLGDDSFESRQDASRELGKSGVGAIALIRTALKDGDPEIVRRCELALKTLEKVPTRSLALAAARLLTKYKDDTITEVLMNYLPICDDESVAEEIHNTFVALAIRDGKRDPVLDAALENRDVLKRSAAAEAFTRVNDKDSRAKMKEFLKKEADSDIKLVIALSLVNDARDKELIPEVIRLMPEVNADKAWKTEELMWRLAGEEGPPISMGSDKPSREKARDEWKKWWEVNEKKVDMAKLDAESSYGLTIVCESPLRGGLGRVVALTGDGKERWSIKGLNWPMDAVPLPGKKVLIAEHNRNRIIEREIDGKEIWSENINQPVSCGRLPNGISWGIGRNQIIEWERGDKVPHKQVFTFIRNEYDIVAGARLKSGEYVLLTQNSQLLKVDRKGTIAKVHAVGGNGVNYYSTVDVLPSGKILVTLMNSLTEFDLESGKPGWTVNYQFATSAVRLRNGNTLVGNQNNGRIQELDKEGKPTKWEYKGTDPSFRPFRAFKR
ncbi:hypothetical protein [Zavarzinella formosa]|uniref:hypothetical protein n=1 Tax=Zavarzinella formosa TaxID=360055 RepID=UPI00031610EE|nr:hypothetical protein [Zavarzinella formosa]